MPEGDTLHKTAGRLKPARQGHRLTRFEAPRLVGDRPALGTVIEVVEARGKILLIHFAGGLTLRTHRRMTGSWYVTVAINFTSNGGGPVWQRCRRS